MNLSDYHRHAAIGSSLLKSLHLHGAQVAYHQWQRGGIEPPSRALVLGSALHLAVESLDKFRNAYMVAPSSYKTATSDKFAQWCGEECGADKIGLTVGEADDVLGMAKAVREFLTPLYRTGAFESERSIFWREQTINGFDVECKCRPDVLWTNTYTGEMRYIEIKTAADPSAKAFRYACSKYGYPLQEAHYATGIGHEFGGTYCPTHFLVVGSSPPYAVRYYEIDQETGLEASRLRGLLLDEIARRQAAQDWRDESPLKPLTVQCGWRLPDVEKLEESEGE